MKKLIRKIAYKLHLPNRRLWGRGRPSELAVWLSVGGAVREAR